MKMLIEIDVNDDLAGSEEIGTTLGALLLKLSDVEELKTFVQDAMTSLDELRSTKTDTQIRATKTGV